MPAKRRLIINADDFGLTAGVNRAIVEAHQHGVVTSATLMANSAAFDDGVRLAKSNPKLSLGCHVVLLDGAPLWAPEEISALLEPDQDPPRLRDKLLPFVSAALRGKIPERQIALEIAAQVQKIRAAGLTPTHLDSHKHTHLFSAILKPLLEVASEFHIRAIRNPFAPIKPLAFAHLARRPKLWTRYSQVKALSRFEASFRKQVAEHGIVTPDGCFGVVVTGALDQRLFESIMACIPEGTWEFVCHPGYNDADLGEIRTRLRESRVAELEVLTSAGARRSLERLGIELVSYRDL